MQGGGALDAEFAQVLYTLNEDLLPTFLVTSVGGIWDQIEFEWEIVEGPGELEFGHPTVMTGLRIDDDIDTITELETPNFVVNGAETLYDSAEFEWEILEGGGEFEPLVIADDGTIEKITPKPIRAPGVRIDEDIDTLTELECPVFVANPVAGDEGFYDGEPEYTWEILEGGGEFVQEFTRKTPARVPAVRIDDDVITITELDCPVFVANISDDGLYDSIEYEWEILEGGGELEPNFRRKTLPIAPNVSIDDYLDKSPVNDLVTMTETQTAIFEAIVSGGLYDGDPEFEWEVISGDGELRATPIPME